MDATLYGYYRSSTSYRVRIALNLKNITYQHMGIHLTRDGGEQHQQAYRKINPQGLVPALLHNGDVFTQSISIIEYLNDIYPEPPLLPSLPAAKAYVQSIAQVIACDIHPLNNLRVLQYLKHNFHITDEQKEEWIYHWMLEGFRTLEITLSNSKFTGEFCYKDEITLADICLIPQIFNAQRFNLPMHDFPILNRINERCLQIPAFQKAHPDRQPDAQN